MRSVWAVSLMLGVAGCSWFNTSGSDGSATAEGANVPQVAAEEPVAEEDPATENPTCRPAGTEPTRGEVPFVVGSEAVPGWSVTAVDTTNLEFIRVTVAKDGVTAELEIAYNEAGPGDWSTRDYRLMPAPEQEPPEELLVAMMARLKTHQADQSGEAFVKKRAGVADPYDGLPPCEP